MSRIAVKPELLTWARERARLDVLVLTKRLPQLAEWEATQRQYEPAAISTFLQVADYYLIVHSLTDGYVVVTHEVPSNTLKRIKIPNACIGLNLRFMTPYDMLRRERARFVVGGAPV